ncbi:acyl-CoA reductase [Alphaproteobacteria bacterium]|nr:acyl-CoA reductase [Alphaproteobacteria bacterium]
MQAKLANICEQINFVLGRLPNSGIALPQFSDPVMSFLDDLSSEIRNNKVCNEHTDLKTFGFWCRSSNIKKIKAERLHSGNVIGRGIALHITPANVAMTFAYSLAFGLLAGNANIVRLPSKTFAQTELLIEILSKLLRQKQNQLVKKFICLVAYERSNTISASLSSFVDVRMLWGGDNTISQFKRFPTKARCLDITFSDRFSVSMIKPSALGNLNDRELDRVTKRFYNDTYYMDQFGCSSPKSVIWTERKYSSQKKRFWTSLEKVVQRNYEYDLSTAAEKFYSLSVLALDADVWFKKLNENFLVTRLDVNNNLRNAETIDGKYGTFSELHIDSISEFVKLISNKFQTVTYFGVTRKEILDAINAEMSFGVDRVVPIGRAFDMGHIWDGYDVINTAAKHIGE